MLVARLGDHLREEQAVDAPSSANELTVEQVADLKVVELREELEQRGLDSTGRKAELSARLVATLGASVVADSSTTADSSAVSMDVEQTISVPLNPEKMNTDYLKMCCLPQSPYQ